ncbi:TPA: O-antigen polymerase [Photobacterium damselae]
MIPILNFLQAFIWIGLLLLPFLNLSNIPPISGDAFFIVLLGIISSLLGGFFAIFIPSKIFVSKNKLLTNKRASFFLTVLMLISIYLIFKLYVFVSSYGFSNIRSLAFIIDDDGNSLIYGSLFFQFFISFVLKPIAYFIYIYSLYLFFIKKESKLLLLSLLAISLISISSLGRFFIYHLLIIFLVSTVVYIRTQSYKISGRYLKLIAGYFLLMIALVVILSYVRGIDNIFQSILNYHLTGLAIFSKELSLNNSLLNVPHDFSFLSFGAFERLFVILINKFGFDYNSITAYVGNYLNVFRDIGGDKAIYMNAFATWYFSLYYDGGLYWVAIALFIYGFILTYFEKSFIKYKDPKSFVICVFMFFLSYFSIFSSMLESSYVFIFLFAIFFIRRKEDIF